jgi:Tol biopolymer transport system component
MNTKGDDFSATLSADGTEMYYTLEEAGKQRVMRSAREGSEFGKGKEVVLIPSVKVQHIGAPTLSGDGQYMVFAALLTEHSGYGRTDLYSARKVNGVWTDIRNLGVTVNSDGWDSQPCLSPDGSTLYFSSDRDNGKGGTDVYRCKRAGNAWLNAEPMPGINTNDDEMSPTITADNRRLYFSSKRLTGMGGFDLYVCALNNDSAGGATMLAAPINSVFNDYALAMSAIGGYACLSSDRPGGAGNIDIYSVPASALPEQHVVVVRGSIERSDTNMRTVPWISVYSLDDSRPPIDV